MKLSQLAIRQLVPFVNGDGGRLYRKGPMLVDLFNKYGARDIYDELGLPDIGKRNGQRPSRSQYSEHRLNQMSEKPELRDLLQQVFSELEPDSQSVNNLNEILNPEGFSVTGVGNSVKIEGGIIDKRKPVVNTAIFQQIEADILSALDRAQVSIDVAMAWFTNEKLRDKLLEKFNEGVRVHVVVFNDGVNAKHGVDLTGLPHKMVRGQRGGIMHNKYCVIDNQIVITGSYNWSTNAEYRNDENISILYDPQAATEFSKEFRKL